MYTSTPLSLYEDREWKLKQLSLLFLFVCGERKCKQRFSYFPIFVPDNSEDKTNCNLNLKMRNMRKEATGNY